MCSENACLCSLVSAFAAREESVIFPFFSAYLLLVSSADNLSIQLIHRSGQAKLSCENVRLWSLIWAKAAGEESVLFFKRMVSVHNHLPAFGGQWVFLQECAYVQSHISRHCFRGKYYISLFRRPSYFLSIHNRFTIIVSSNCFIAVGLWVLTRLRTWAFAAQEDFVAQGNLKSVNNIENSTAFPIQTIHIQVYL